MAVKQTDIIISGAGIAGLTLAALLGEAGLDIHIIDIAEPPPVAKIKPSGRTVALMESSLNIIKATSIWDAIKPFSNPLETMQIIDKDIRAEFHASDINLEQFGFNIPNGILLATLFEKVKEIPSVTMQVPKALSDYTMHEGHVVAILDDDTNLQAHLLIGADGRNSTVRQISGIETSNHNYGQSAITCLINHSRSHGNTSTEFHRANGPLALVPLPGNQSSVVWVEKTPRADEITALKKNEFIQVLQEATDDILGGITLEANPQSWPLSSIKAKKLIAPRIALMAEAAHVISPITAQGLNLSLRDVAALSETIIDAMRAGLDPGSSIILQKYQKRRLVDINTRVFGVDCLNRAVSSDMGFVKNLRRSGMRTIENIPLLKKMAMRHGLAPQTDISRLAKGQPL